MKPTLALTAFIVIFTTMPLTAADKGKVAKGKPGSHSPEKEFEELLKQCDKDGDGVVTREEFLKNQPPGKDPAKSKEWFDKKDLNHDGKLTREEFVSPPNKGK